MGQGRRSPADPEAEENFEAEADLGIAKRPRQCARIRLGVMGGTPVRSAGPAEPELVLAAHPPGDAPQDGGVRPPATPEEFDYRQQDRQANAGNGAEHNHPYAAADREPELPALNAVNKSPEFREAMFILISFSRV